MVVEKKANAWNCLLVCHVNPEIAGKSAKSAQLSNTPVKKVWERPRATCLKLKVDAVFNIEDLSGAIGSIIRDNLGNFLDAPCKYIQHVPCASMAEVCAIQAGLQLAIQTGCRMLEDEFNFTKVIQYCSGKNQMLNGAIAISAHCLGSAGIFGKMEFEYC
jgi:hypothetical protein